MSILNLFSTLEHITTLKYVALGWFSSHYLTFFKKLANLQIPWSFPKLNCVPVEGASDRAFAIA